MLSDRKKYLQEYYKKNKVKLDKYRKKWLIMNKIKMKKYFKKYNLKYRQTHKKYFKEYRKKHIKEIRKKHNKYYKTHKKEKQLYYQKTKKQRYEYSNNRFKTNINFRLRTIIKNRINMALKRNSKSSSSIQLLGCTIPELKQHLQKQFKKGMNWNNYGLKGWHIDHKIPCNNFDLSKPKEQIKCFNYKNLQPLWAEDNLKRRIK